MTPPACVLLANGAAAAEFLDHATREEWPIERVVLNAPDRQRDADRLRALAQDHGIPVSTWAPDVIGQLTRHASSPGKPWLLSLYFGHIVPGSILMAFSGRAVNVHPSLLPWGRGTHPNVWSLIEGTPAGASLHVMTEEVDRGPILAQRVVATRLSDTGGSVYAKLERACVELAVEAWPRVEALLPGTPQSASGTYHQASEFATLAEYDLGNSAEAADFFHRLRALSFEPYAGLKVRLGSEVVEARVDLTPTVRSATRDATNGGDSQ